MDAFGIGNAIRGMVQVYYRSCRQSGRTAALVESLNTGDRVIFLDEKEAKRVQSLCKELGKIIDVKVVSVTYPEKLSQFNTPQGRLVFDHSWVEAFYKTKLESASKEIDYLQRQFGGFGMAHVETRMKARNKALWQF